MNAQGWNRYSYVGNDPLAFTDPNGFSRFSSFFHSVGNFFSGIARDVTHFFQTNAIARSILQIGATIILNIVLPGSGALVGALAAVGGAAIATGLSGGNLGQILKAAAIAGATYFAFSGLGPTPSLASMATNPGTYIANVAGSAAVGCASSVASGGSCGSGALSGAVGSALSPITCILWHIFASSNRSEKLAHTIFLVAVVGFSMLFGLVITARLMPD